MTATYPGIHSIIFFPKTLYAPGLLLFGLVGDISLLLVTLSHSYWMSEGSVQLADCERHQNITPVLLA